MNPELDSLHHMAPRCLWGVSNALVELPDGNIMISCQFLSRIYIIDKATGAIKWRWGQPEITFQHQPTLLDNGNILLLDNRRWIPYAGAGYSRVIEVNPFYEGHPLNPAFGRTNLIHRAYRYGPDYPGLHGKKLDPKGKLDLWNRLYGPESWGALTGSSQRQTGETETKVDSAGPETAVPATAFKSSAPSVAPPSVRGKKTRSRLESLGY